MTLTLQLTDEQSAALNEGSQRLGKPIEEIAVLGIEDYLRRKQNIDESMARLLDENAELYPAFGPMIYLDLDDIHRFHEFQIRRFGGNPAILNLGLIESAVAQPQMTFGGQELYPTVEEKAAAMAFSLACNHGYADGNKRVAHLAMAVFLDINGFRIDAYVDEQESVFMRLADHKMSRAELVQWIREHLRPAGR